MNAEEEADKPREPKDGVPQKLIDQLHEANERFSKAREHMDRAIDAEINGTIERERASDDVRAAEGDLEKLDGKIAREIEKK